MRIVFCKEQCQILDMISAAVVSNVRAKFHKEPSHMSDVNICNSVLLKAMSIMRTVFC